MEFRISCIWQIILLMPTPLQVCLVEPARVMPPEPLVAAGDVADEVTPAGIGTTTVPPEVALRDPLDWANTAAGSKTRRKIIETNFNIFFIIAKT
jgi:hypothetical protein